MGDNIRRDDDQLPTALSPIAQKIDIVLPPGMLIEEDFSAVPLYCWPPVLATQRRLVRAAGDNSSYFQENSLSWLNWKPGYASSPQQTGSYIAPSWKASTL